jgi:hypothetical protein
MLLDSGVTCFETGGVGATMRANEMDGFMPGTGASLPIPSLLRSEDSLDSLPASLPSVSAFDDAELGVEVDVGVDPEVAD